MGLIMGIAAIAGGWLAGGGGAGDGSFALLGSSGVVLVFAISFAGRLASLLLLARIKEPDSLPLAAFLKSAARLAIGNRVLAAAPIIGEPIPAEAAYKELAIAPAADRAD